MLVPERKPQRLQYFDTINLCNQIVTYIFVTKRLLIMRRDVFQAIADPLRRDIIHLLAEETLTVNAIAKKFDVSRPAVSKHLKILEECGLITCLLYTSPSPRDA